MLLLIKKRHHEKRAAKSIYLASLAEPIKLLGFHDILRLLTLGLIFHTVGCHMLFPFISVHAISIEEFRREASGHEPT
jgi:hypothetical protein